jgi:hypothetical protein
MPQLRRRQVLALSFAAVAGLALGLLDSSPGFDATGITAGGLLLAGAGSALIDRSGALDMAFVYAIVCAAWIIALEWTAAAGAGAVLFAAIGAIGAALLVRLSGPRRSFDA